MDGNIITEKQIGRTVYFVKSECSPSATETVEQKLERLICRRFSDAKSYPPVIESPLAMRGIQSEHGTNLTPKE